MFRYILSSSFPSLYNETELLIDLVLDNKSTTTTAVIVETSVLSTVTGYLTRWIPSLYNNNVDITNIPETMETAKTYTEYLFHMTKTIVPLLIPQSTSPMFNGLVENKLTFILGGMIVLLLLAAIIWVMIESIWRAMKKIITFTLKLVASILLIIVVYIVCELWVGPYLFEKRYNKL